MARAYENAGRLADAETAFRKAADLQPNDWDGHNTLAMFLGRHSQYSQAIAEYKVALQLVPDNAQVLFNLGGTYIDSGDPKVFPEAEASLKRSLAINPSYPAYANLGALYDREGKYQEAAEQTRKALDLNSQNYVIWQNLIADYEWLKQPDKAADARHHEILLLEQTVQQNPRDAVPFSLLADSYSADHEREKALASLRTALALAPEDPTVLGNAADVYENLGDRPEASAYIEKTLKHGGNKQQFTSDAELQNALNDPAIKVLLK